MVDDEQKTLTEYHEFFFLVGEAITEWAHVDRCLFNLCRFALNVSERKTAAVFYRSPSIREHVILVDDLLQDSLSAKNLRKWEEYSSAIHKLLPFRNHIAHNPPIQTVHLRGSWGESSQEVIDSLPKLPDPWWSIETDPSKTLLKPRKKVAKQEHLIEHMRAVNQLLRGLYALEKSLPKRPLDRPPKSCAPATPQRSAQKSRRTSRNRSKRRSRPRSS